MPSRDARSVKLPSPSQFGLWSLLVAAALGSLVFAAPAAWARPPVRVAASIYPFFDMARAVGGNRVEVTLLLPAGADSHSWEPRAGDVMRLQRAEVVLLVGEGMEPWASDLLRGAGRHEGQYVIETAAGAPLLRPDSALERCEGTHAEEGHDGHGHGEGPTSCDPHVWLDFSWDRTVTRRLVDALCALDPEGAPTYRGRGETYVKRLEALDRAYRDALATCRHRLMIIGGHAAFGYLARAYGLRQAAAYGISPDAQPTPRRLAELTDLVRDEGVRAIFFDQAASGRVARTLSEETGVRTYVLTSGASLTRKELAEGATFLDLMYRNLDQLVEGLGCPASPPRLLKRDPQVRPGPDR